MRSLRLVASLAITYLGWGEGAGAARIDEFNYYAIPIGGLINRLFISVIISLNTYNPYNWSIIVQFRFVGISYWGGFYLPPDRIVCGPPPLRVTLFAFCKGSLIYKIKVWGRA